jgi:hypothetical protein
VAAKGKPTTHSGLFMSGNSSLGEQRQPFQIENICPIGGVALG